MTTEMRGTEETLIAKLIIILDGLQDAKLPNKNNIKVL